MKPETLIHIAFIFGLLTNFSKVTNLFILPDTQKKMQNRFELFALKVDELNPLIWYIYLFKEHILTRTTKYILLLILTTFAILLIMIITVQEQPNRLGFIFIIICVILWVRLFLNEYKSLIIKNIIEICSNGNFKNFLKKYFIHLLPAITLYIFCLIFKSLDKKSFLFDVFCLIGAFISILSIIKLVKIMNWSVITFIGLSILLIKPILYLFKLLIKTFNFFTYRIANYKQGVFEALSIILTIIFGIAEVFIKYRK